MKVSLSIFLSRDGANKYFQIKMLIKVVMSRDCLKGKAFMHGQMELFMKENFQKDTDMEKACFELGMVLLLQENLFRKGLRVFAK